LNCGRDIVILIKDIVKLKRWKDIIKKKVTY
jgi:hypothetical protein